MVGVIHSKVHRYEYKVQVYRMKNPTSNRKSWSKLYLCVSFVPMTEPLDFLGIWVPKSSNEPNKAHQHHNSNLCIFLVNKGGEKSELSKNN
jgi:hypothetical protein